MFWSREAERPCVAIAVVTILPSNDSNIEMDPLLKTERAIAEVEKKIAAENGVKVGKGVNA